MLLRSRGSRPWLLTVAPSGLRTKPSPRRAAPSGWATCCR